MSVISVSASTLLPAGPYDLCTPSTIVISAPTGASSVDAAMAGPRVIRHGVGISSAPVGQDLVERPERVDPIEVNRLEQPELRVIFRRLVSDDAIGSLVNVSFFHAPGQCTRRQLCLPVSS